MEESDKTPVEGVASSRTDATSKTEATSTQDVTKKEDATVERSTSRDAVTAMVPAFNALARGFARRYFSHFELEPETVKNLRDMEERGSVVYVMRYSSRLDYFLLNALFAREGLRLSAFANGIRFHYFGTFLNALRTTFTRSRALPDEVQHEHDRQHARALALGGQSQFLFLRTQRVRRFFRRRRSRERGDELDLLKEVVQAVWDTDRPVFVVPVALFWRKGPRSESRFLNLNYGALFRPSDLAKVTSFLATYRSLSVKIGNAVDLQRFISSHRGEGPSRVARKVRRSLLIYLFREEKVVEGPTLKARFRVQREVLADPGVRETMEQVREERGWTRERTHAAAQKIFLEIAASMNSTFLAAMNVAVSAIFRRLFSSIEIYGLEKVAENVKHRPVVLVPSHRSYFDFLILSVLLYGKFMVPPHIAARENMAFGPFGAIFRRCGAFFLRKSFDDPLYKEIFRSYVGYLVREGFTQEFFIEGGRSRSGKTMPPRLGMLMWDVDAFIDSHQRDMVIIPVAITYERLVEESAMLEELSGGEKTEESMSNLFRARKYLQRRFGSAHVCFGNPISLADALGEKREVYRQALPDDEAIEAEKRDFVSELGWRVVEQINWSFVANATSVAASAVMGAPSHGIRREDLVARMGDFVDLLALQKTRITKALLADRGDFEDSISFLIRSDLLEVREDLGGEILYYQDSRRQALDLYRNSIAHFMAVPSYLARRILAGAPGDELAADLDTWHSLFYQEFYFPKSGVSVEICEAILGYFVEKGYTILRDGLWVPTDVGRPVFENLAEQTRGVIDVYSVACVVAGDLDDEVTRKAFVARLGTAYESASMLGEARRVEAANDTTFSNAVDLLISRGVLHETQRDVVDKKGKPRGSERVLVPAEDPAPLERLRDDLRVSGPLRGAFRH